MAWDLLQSAGIQWTISLMNHCQSFAAGKGEQVNNGKHETNGLQVELSQHEHELKPGNVSE